MECPRCRAPNREAAQFCRACGQALGGSCPRCGHRVEADSRYCDVCGGAMPGERAGPASAAPASPFARLAREALVARRAHEGERKQVTVLFADLKGSLELLADRDPEEARALLDPVVQCMMDAVHRYEGTVNHVLGDGIMALFGAPIGHEDHALRACYAALRMQEELRRHAPTARPAGTVPIEVRVGLNSGEVVLRSLDSDFHADYSAVGQTTHLASRMEQMAPPGSILITADTLRLVADGVSVRPLGGRAVKGLDHPIDVFELTGAVTLPSPFRPGAARGLSQFVGRTAELEAMRRALARVREGQGQIVAVTGEPGVGKTRLFHEFGRSGAARGARVLEVAAVSHGMAIAFLPVVELLRRYLGVDDRATPETVARQVTGRVLALGESLRPALAPVLYMLGALPEEDPFRALDPAQRRRAILEAFTQLLVREAQRQPLIVICENLHWLDSESQAALDALVEAVPSQRVLLLANYRPEYEDTWTSKPGYTRLQLDPLPPSDADVLLDALLGAAPALGQVKTFLRERTGGNPFFIEECIRTLAETRIVSGARGAYQLARDPSAFEIPPTVHALLAARIDRLDAEDKRLLQSAAVVGRSVPLALLTAIAEEPPDDVRARLARLRAGEFLYETSLFPDITYVFKHALIQEVAYASLIHERRRALHARLVSAIEALHEGRASEQAEHLAHHALRGEVWDKAAVYCRLAGGRAAERSSYREAATCLERALEALAHLPRTPERMADAIDLRFELRNALFPLGEVARDLEHLRSAGPLVEALADRRRAAWVAAYMARDLSLLGDQERAVEAAGRALTLATQLGDEGLCRLTTSYLGVAHHARGSYRLAIDALRAAVAGLQGELGDARLGLPGPAAVFFRAWLAWALARVGEFGEAVGHGQEGVRIAEAAAQPLATAVATYSLGLVRLQQGGPPAALRDLERSFELCRAWDLRAWFPNIASSLGYAYALAGRVGEGIRLLEEAVERTESMGILVNHASELTWLGEAYLAGDRPEDAARCGTRSLQLTRAQGERGNEAWALRLLGDVASRRGAGSPEPALAHCEAALALASELAMAPLVARCHLDLGRLHARAGRPEVAEVHRVQARAMCAELGMAFWQERRSDDAR